MRDGVPVYQQASGGEGGNVLYSGPQGYAPSAVGYSEGPNGRGDGGGMFDLTAEDPECHVNSCYNSCWDDCGITIIAGEH